MTEGNSLFGLARGALQQFETAYDLATVMILIFAAGFMAIRAPRSIILIAVIAYAIYQNANAGHEGFAWYSLVMLVLAGIYYVVRFFIREPFVLLDRILECHSVNADCYLDALSQYSNTAGWFTGWVSLVVLPGAAALFLWLRSGDVNMSPARQGYHAALLILLLTLMLSGIYVIGVMAVLGPIALVAAARILTGFSSITLPEMTKAEQQHFNEQNSLHNSIQRQKLMDEREAAESRSRARAAGEDE